MGASHTVGLAGGVPAEFFFRRKSAAHPTRRAGEYGPPNGAGRGGWGGGGCTSQIPPSADGMYVCQPPTTQQRPLGRCGVERPVGARG